MAKAEQRAFEKFPKILVRNGTYDVNKNKRVVYLMAYRQAEKDVNDAFIEKATKWFKENLLNHTYVYEGEVGIGMDVFLGDFKKAMKI